MRVACRPSLGPELGRSAADGVVARKLGKRPVETDLLVGSGVLERLGARHARGAVGSDVEAAVGVVDAVGAGAGPDGVLETVLVGPALEVVACIFVSMVSNIGGTSFSKSYRADRIRWCHPGPRPSG